MEAGMIATLVIGSLLTTGAVVGVTSTNGDMMQGTMDSGHTGGWFHSMGHGMTHDHDEHEEECEEWENGNREEMHEECEEHMEERENEDSFEDENHEEHDHCGMMG